MWTYKQRLADLKTPATSLQWDYAIDGISYAVNSGRVSGQVVFWINDMDTSELKHLISNLLGKMHNDCPRTINGLLFSCKLTGGN